jgi:tetratricopeptide (TPR) repeat protein
MALSTVAMCIIDEAVEVFGSEPPSDIRDVLDRLFIVRENREQLDELRPRSFSELLEDIPAVNGRLEVLRHLAESFPGEAHYWAHYGRLLSYAVGDTRAALDALNKALTLDESDSVLYHIRGMVYLRKLRDLSRAPFSSLDESELLQVAELALADFNEAVRLKDDSEYPYVASVQVTVTAIETAYRRSGSSSHSEFLARPASAPYRLLLEQAEAAIDAIAEIDGGDQPSSRVEEVNVELSALYDDYSALLQGWRNLLDRRDVNKVPVRRRLVRAYFRRAGGWSELSRADRDRVLILLEENLRDDPTDSRSLRDWLRVARVEGTNIDRASELVSYWASQSTSRDALYYDYVLAVLQVFEGRDSVRYEAQRKIERCRERAAAFGNRRFSYEWLGDGAGLDMLVHYTDLPLVWDRNSPDDVPSVLRRVSGRVARIGSPQAGTLRLNAGGLDAFFVPALAGVLRNRHENARVDAVIGFSYDGLRAWAVRLMTDDDK